mmetsp:Transcript_15111/g.42851  ORF Transcript_15111/g.42851 Transcript_15111/m.42851 type:complete len:268 (-) Transcript_15111:254-1057(-)
MLLRSSLKAGRLATRKRVPNHFVCEHLSRIDKERNTVLVARTRLTNAVLRDEQRQLGAAKNDGLCASGLQLVDLFHQQIEVAPGVRARQVRVVSGFDSVGSENGLGEVVLFSSVGRQRSEHLYLAVREPRFACLLVDLEPKERLGAKQADDDRAVLVWGDRARDEVKAQIQHVEKWHVNPCQHARLEVVGRAAHHAERCGAAVYKRLRSVVHCRRGVVLALTRHKLGPTGDGRVGVDQQRDVVLVPHLVLANTSFPHTGELFGRPGG